LRSGTRPVGRRVAVAGGALAALAAGAALAWYYSPAGAPARYQRMSLVDLRRHLEGHPRDRVAWRTLGLRLARDGDALAERPLREAFALDPSDPEVATGLGELLLATGRLPEAFQVLRAAVEHNPDFVLARMALGRLYRRKGSYLHAVEQYEHAAKVDPRNGDAWHELAMCYLQMQQSQKAQEAMRRALEIEPRHPHYLSLKASVDAATGQVDSGIEAARKAASIAPTDLKIQVNLANILLAHQRGPEDLRAAEEAIGQVEALAPDYPLKSYLRGELERLRGNWQVAARYLEQAVRDAPEQNEVYFSLFQTYRRLNRRAEASRMEAIFRRRQELQRQIDNVRIALGADSDNVALYARLIELQLRAGDERAALGSLQAAAQIDPAAPQIQKYLRRLPKEQAAALTRRAP